MEEALTTLYSTNKPGGREAPSGRNGGGQTSSVASSKRGRAKYAYHEVL